MPISLPAKSVALQTAFAADKPVVLAQHHLRDSSVSPPRWTTDGLWTGTDITDPNRPTTRLYDGRMVYPSAPSDQTLATYYLNFRFDTVAFDGIFLNLITALDTYTITVEASDTADFSAPLFVTDWSGVTGTRRRSWLSSNSIWTDVEYLRISFVNTTGTIVPRIGEVMIGQSRQLSRKFNIGHDDQMQASEVREFRSKNRSVTTYVDARGFSDLHAEATPTGSDNYGLDDVTAFRGIFTDSIDGTERVAFFRAPFSLPNSSLFGKIAPRSNMPLQGPAKRLTEFDFEEQPPFLSRET